MSTLEERRRFDRIVDWLKIPFWVAVVIVANGVVDPEEMGTAWLLVGMILVREVLAIRAVERAREEASQPSRER